MNLIKEKLNLGQLSDSKKKALYIGGGILFFFLCYLLVFNNLIAKADGVWQEIDELEPVVTQLRSYYDHLEEYEQVIASDQNTIDEYKLHYPNAIRPEDKTMYAVELEKENDIKIESVTFGEDAAVASFQVITGETEGSFSTTTATAIRSPISISCNTTYHGLKSTLGYIMKTNNRTRVNTLGISYDAATGRLSGNMDIDKYAIKGIDDTYKPAEIPDMPMGTANIFNSGQ